MSSGAFAHRLAVDRGIDVSASAASALCREPARFGARRCSASKRHYRDFTAADHVEALLHEERVARYLLSRLITSS